MPKELTPQRWKQINGLLQQALELPADERQAFLDQNCMDDEVLRGEVLSLLRADQQTGALLDQPLPLRSLHDPPVVERRVGTYKLIRELGRGGMGAVYLAERDDDQQFHQQVAIKLIKRGMDTDEIIKRFRYERRILASLNHPNIAHFLDGGTTEDGLPYFVMEYIEGEPLLSYCERKQLGIAERLRLFLQVCAAVQHAHRNLIVHRDLKPSNIMVADDGTVKLLDFGIAKLLHTGADRLSSVLGQRPMTPEYASPEQVCREAITTTSDVYSLGVVLYELLAGERPYRLAHRNAEEMARIICEQEPIKPSAAAESRKDERGRRKSGKAKRLSSLIPHPSSFLASSLRGDLDNIVLKALSKPAERRYASVEQFADDIRRHLAGKPVLARPDTLGYRTGKFIRRHRAGVAAAVMLVVILLAGVIATTWQAGIARAEQRKAESERANAQNQQSIAERERERAERALATAQAEQRRAEDALLKVEEERNRAEQALALAQREQARAETERDKASQVSDFIVNLFQASNPQVSKGDKLTVREVLDRGAKKIDRELQRQPEVRARLMQTIGAVYYSLGFFPQAAEMHKQAAAVRESLLGRNHPDTAESLVGYAAAQGQLGMKWNAGERILRGALQTQRAALGADHPSVATTLFRLGELTWWGKRDPVAAEPIFRESLDIRRRRIGNVSAEVAESLSAVAGVLPSRGQWEEAEQSAREALAINQQLYPEDDANVGLPKHALAIILHDRKKYAEAETFFAGALAAARKTWPDGHVSTANALVWVGNNKMKLGQFKEAEVFYRECHEIRRKLLPANSPDVIGAEADIGAAMAEQGRYAEAEPLLRRGFFKFRDAFGMLDWSTDKADVLLRNLYVAWHQPENLTQYLAVYTESARDYLQMVRTHLGEQHAKVGEAKHVLAQALFDCGKYDEAETMAQEAQAIAEKHRPGGAGTTVLLLGKIKLKRGDAPAAGPLMRKGLELIRNTAGGETWRVGLAENDLGVCLFAQGRYEEAEALLTSAYQQLKTGLSARDYRTQDARQNLLTLYQAWGKPNKAAEYQAQQIQ